jgi:hypothetical protein
MFVSFLRYTSLIGSILFALGGGITTAHAADPKHTIRDEAYSAKFVSQSIADPVQMEVGESKAVIFKFRNTGTATWSSAGAQFLSAYTIEPRYRTSEFKGTNWIAPRQTAKIDGIVKPGEVGELKLELTAPTQPGEYREEFYLAAENYSWVKGGYFYIKISVSEKKVGVATPTVAETKSEMSVTSAHTGSEAYRAKRVILSKKQMSARGGEEVPVILAFQNIGTSTWNSYTVYTQIKNTTASPRVLVEKTTTLPQWSVARENVHVKVPERAGEYTLSVVLKANGVTLPEELGTISVTVTEDAAIITEEELSHQSTPEEAVRLTEEPRIRVGVWKNPEKGVEFVSGEETYNVFDGETFVGTVAPGIRVSMWQSKGAYYFKGPELEFSTKKFIRLAPVSNPHAVFRLPNYERLLSYRGKLSFNAYRGAMEYRTTNNSDATYVINDLLFEDYIAGIAETSNDAHTEYVKAILTAARTYAYYMQNHKSTETAVFDVVATTADQLYLGYESEILMPRVAEAARATRGMMITYDTDNNIETPAEIVITPYFANADTRTRSWSEVWSGVGKPWLVSVPTEYDKRDKKKLFGHGVGMSARDASVRASEKSEMYDTILKYYYTGVEVEKMYQ